MTASPFNVDFLSARTLFLQAASAAGAHVESYGYPLPGPQGDALSTDVAWIGPLDANKVFVTVSGTHGIEGFCGSGAQIDWLQRGEATRLAPGTASMLIHAINPFGFAWQRRVTHENVDLNRNWIDFSQPLPQRGEYDAIAAALCPLTWTDASRAETLAVLFGYIAKHGYAALVNAVSCGQYHHPQGLFFGGTAPTVARLNLQRILTERLAQAEHIAIIDYHSGLGPYGYGEIMTSAPLESPVWARARAWYGASVTPKGAAGSASAAIGGDWLAATPTLLPHATVTAIAIEFGTVEIAAVLESLRADNWLHTHGDPNSTVAALIKQQIRDAFYVDTDAWRGMVLGQALATSRQTIAGLQS